MRARAKSLGAEDAAQVTGSGAEAAEDADLAGALDDVHGDGVDQAEHADGDDEQPDALHDHEHRLGLRQAAGPVRRR